MGTKIRNKALTGITEEKVITKPKHQAILSLIAYFQHNNKNIQRAHLIRVLVKNTDPNLPYKDVISNENTKIIKSEEPLFNDNKITKKQHVDINSLEKKRANRKRILTDITSKIMFNSVANLDKTLQQLRKLGLITNQYKRGYPRIVLTHKGYIVFYTVIYPSIIFYTITQLINELL